MEINRLYPQYNIIQERRQKVVPISPVAFERRSGIDRRNDDRVKLDTTLTRDIFEIKSKVAEIQKAAPQKAEKIAFTQNASNVAQQNLKTDQFIKSMKPEANEGLKPMVKAKSDAGTIAGILGIMLGGTLAATFLGVAGIGVAVGLGAYFGGKVLRSAIVSHLKNK